MKQHRICALLLVLTLFLLLPLATAADFGPKPSVHIDFPGLGEELCYGTLLSKSPSTGPASVWDGQEDHAAYHEGDEDYDIWKTFVDYSDSDGYYFLQHVYRVDETKMLHWGYYPPSPFKILLYYPERNLFVSSAVCERYAFDSYFTATLLDDSTVEITFSDVSQSTVSSALSTSETDNASAAGPLWNDEGPMEVTKTYDYAGELLSLAARIVLTILVELVIALLFGYRSKKQIYWIAGINIVTQVALNVWLNIIQYYHGPLSFILSYILLEFLVFLIEGVLYAVFLANSDDKKSKRFLAVLYAFVANAVSFGTGMALARILPGIF